MLLWPSSQTHAQGLGENSGTQPVPKITLLPVKLDDSATSNMRSFAQKNRLSQSPVRDQSGLSPSESAGLASDGPASGQAGLTRANAGSGGNVANIVRSIMDYTKWPRAKPNMTLCVIGAARNASNLNAFQLAKGQRVKAVKLAENAASFTQCDVLYLGVMRNAQLRRATSMVQGKGVLTIAENDPSCSGRAMFCLLYSNGSVGFRLNLDSISRSGLRVDPRVFRLARGRSAS